MSKQAKTPHGTFTTKGTKFVVCAVWSQTTGKPIYPTFHGEGKTPAPLSADSVLLGVYPLTRK